ncbi:MAG TPA: hypothetical protein VM553_21365 [Dongiaceae bacterium]|nr:hypothetical protein [Dongiaceae bacterium]
MSLHARIALPLLIVTSLLLTACGTTRMTDVWQADGFSRKQMQTVLVVAVTSNVTNRTIFEATFVKELQSKGIKAVPSIQAIGEELPTKEAVGEFLSKTKVDHVVAVTLASVDLEVERVPESVATYVTGPYYYAPTMHGFWGGYNSFTMTRASYIDTQTNLILTTSVYSAETQQLAWAGRSKSFEVNAVSQVSSELARQMISKMDR